MKPSSRLSRLHFIGIGGSGMSSMAEVFAAWGFQVSGSDRQDSETLVRLRSLGIRAEVGHRAANVGDAQVLIYSSAVPADNPELAWARQTNLPTVRRAEMLGEALRGKYALGVAGTHGKTTTTTMLGSIWMHAGQNPTLLAGGTTRGENFSAVAGTGPVCIFEADEFDRSFLAMRPTAAIIGNVDSDHLDIYGTLDAIRDAFTTFAESLPFYGLLVANLDDEGVRAILPGLAVPNLVTYGLGPNAEYRAVQVMPVNGGMIFTLQKRGTALGELKLKVPGIHNVYNALAAATLSLEEGRSFAEVAAGLVAFQGVKRRLEYLGMKSGIAFYDDYAHHPTEVAAALQAVRTLASGRVVAIFQPHLYSRTQQLFQEFSVALQACDLLFVTRVYAAREFPIPGVEGNLITDAVQKAIPDRKFVHYIEDLDGFNAMVRPQLKSGDVVIALGAGDIGARCGQLLEAMA